MERYTIAQRINIVKIHYRNGEHFANTVRKVRTDFGRRQAPSRTAIVKLIAKFERLGQVTDVKNLTRLRTARSIEQITAAAESYVQDPEMSLRRRSQQLGIKETSLHRILHEDLGLMLFVRRRTPKSVPISDYKLKPKKRMEQMQPQPPSPGDSTSFIFID